MYKIYLYLTLNSFDLKLFCSCVNLIEISAQMSSSQYWYNNIKMKNLI